MAIYRRCGWLVCLALIVLAGVAQGQTPVPETLKIPLFPGFDQFGNQFEVVQAYENGAGQRSITTGIYDTGASVVTFSSLDQEFFFPFQGQPAIPTIPGAVATADAIGGSLTGKVSTPGRIYAAGASALTIDFNNFSFSYDLTDAVSTGNVQAFVGTSSGSPNLPAIVGTPINVPSETNPNGLATIMDQTGYSINLGDLDPSFGNIEYQLPDVRFVQPGTNLTPKASTYHQVTIPVSLYGIDNTGNPGMDVSAAPNPVQHHTAVSYKPSAPDSVSTTVSDQTFLFDTGAQLSIISPAIAAQLGLTDLQGNPIVAPFDTIDVQGAGDQVAGLPGYVLESLRLPRSDGGFLEFNEVPVYVLDIGFGLDGILGMNLFNGADSFIYDPYNPAGAQVSALFLNDRSLDSVTEEAGLFQVLDDPNAALAAAILAQLGSRHALANPLLPGMLVPEPSTYLLGVIGLVAVVACRRRRGA